MSNRMKTAWAVVCAIIAVTVLAPMATAQESSSCLSGIEKWMRGCQARKLQMQGRAAFWPGCCSTGHAPFYPPDNYYTDALKDNPALGQKLVEACQTEFHRFLSVGGDYDYLPLANYFAKVGGHGATSLDGVKFTEMGAFVDSADMTSYGLTVTPSNYCEIFGKLKADLAELKGVYSGAGVPNGRGVGLVQTGSNDAVSGSDLYSSPPVRCLNQEQCDSDPETAFNLAKAEAQYCWLQHGYQGGPPYPAGPITVDQHAEYSSDIYSNTCWYLRVGASKGFVNSDLTAFKITGTAKLYVAGTGMCDGVTPRLNCVVDPATLDAYDANVADLTWREFQTVSIPKRDAPYQSATMAESTSLPLTYSFTDGPNCDTTTTGKAGHRGWMLRNAEGLVLPDWDNVAADSEKKCGDNCGQCQPGVPQVALGGSGRDGSPDPTANVYWPLGKLDTGHSAGDLQFFDMGISAGGVTPERVIANMPDLGGTESIVDTVSSVRQFVTASTIVDVRALTSGTGIAIKFYHFGSCTAPTTSDTGLTTDLWTFTGASPFAHTEISYSTTGVYNPANPTTTTTVGGAAKYKIEEILPGSHVWEISKVGTDWLLRSGIVSTTPTSLESRTFGTASGDKTSTRKILEANGTLVYQAVEQWHNFAWGSEVVQLTIGTTGGDGVLTSTRSFYESAGTGAIVGRLKEETDFHGNWKRYTYDSQGRVANIVSAFGDNVSTTADSSNRVESHAYYLLDVDGGSTGNDVVEEIIERVQNVPVTRTYLVTFVGTASRISGIEGTRFWTIRCTDATPPTSETALAEYLRSVWNTEMGTGSGNGWGLGASDVSETIRNAIDDDDPVGRVLTSLRHDGAFTWNVYYDAYNSSVSNAPASWNTATFSVSGQMGNLSTSPYVTCGTERRTFRNAQGTVLLATTKDLASTNITSHSTVDPTGSFAWVDEFGRAERVYDVLTGLYAETVYSCCGIDSQTDEHGIITKYDYDALTRVTKVSTQVGPVVSSAYPSIKSITEYDAAGRVKATKRQDTANSTPVLVSANTYDPAGRLTSSSNYEGTAGTTTYSESYNSTTGLTTRTEIMPDPDGTGSGNPLPSPQNVRIYHRDGSLYKVNVPFDSAIAASAPEQYAYGATTSPAGYRFVIRYPTSASITSSSLYTETFTDPLGRTKWVFHSLTSSTHSTDEYTYSDADRAVLHTDPDGVKTITIRGTGPAQATYQGSAIFSGGVPTTLASYFSGQWNLTVKKVNSSSTITVSATGAPADRMSLSGSWIYTRPSTSIPVRHSATIVWADDTANSAVIETSSTDSLLSGLESWTTSFERTTNTATVVGTGGTIDGTTTTTSSDCTGAKTITRTLYGRQDTVERRDPSNTFVSQTDIKYDTLGRLSQTQLWRTTSHSSNANCDFTDFTYYAGSGRVYQRTDPSPTNGTTTSDRTLTTYVYDHLGRVTSVTLPSSKQTTTTYTAAGQVKTVRGFGVNPVDYGYDEQGRMHTLTTYKDVAAPSGAAVTTWNYHSTSGRLETKLYQGSSSSNPDLAYTYSTAGRLSTRTDAREQVTTYSYADYTKDLSKVSYDDGVTPTVLYQNYDRFGRPGSIVDAGGKHDLTYTDEGKLLIDAITSDSGITDAPHLNLLSGVTTTDSYDYGTEACGTVRVAHEASVESSPINTVNFEYDSLARLKRVKKSGADVQYTYDPVTGQVLTSTNRKNTTSTTYVARWLGTRNYDRLGRLSNIEWTTSSGTNPGLGGREWTYDAYGRRVNLRSTEVSEAESWAYGYDDFGQLTQAAAEFASTAEKIPGGYYEYAYDDIGNRTSVTNGNADDSYSMAYTSNALNQYTERDVSRYIEVSGYTPASTVLVTDPNGTVTADRFLDGSTLLYDGFYHTRLSETGDNAQKVPVTVNIYGNDTLQNVFLPKHPQNFTYDENGNLTADALWYYTYDGENRLVAMQLNEDVGSLLIGQNDYWLRLEFAYDYMGRRISKRLIKAADNLAEVEVGSAKVEWGESYWQKFVYDTGSWNLSAILSCDAETGEYLEPDQTFAWGPDLSATEQGAGGIGGLAIYLDDSYDLHNSSTANGPMFPTYDGNGNIIALFDASADSNGLPEMKAQYHYGPFGEERGRWGPVEASRFPFRWSTKYTDNETGLVYYGYRYYSASLGRWISRDPMQESGGLLLAGFLGNDPVSRGDYLGRLDWSDLDELRKLLKQAVTDSIAGSAEAIYNFLQAHPLTPSEIALINSALPPVKAAAAKVVDTNPATMNWLDLTLAWLFELGPAVYTFGPGDYTTESIRGHQGVNQARELAHAECEKGNHVITHQWTFGVDQFWNSIATVDVAGEFLGTYAIRVTSDTCCDSFHFHAWNSTSWESGTRFRRGEVPGGTHRGILPSRKRGAPGIQLGGTIEEHWEWDETAGGAEK